MPKAAEFPNCPKCQDNRLVTGLPTSYVCSRCGCTFIPDGPVLKDKELATPQPIKEKKCPPDCDHRYNKNCIYSCYEDED